MSESESTHRVGDLIGILIPSLDIVRYWPALIQQNVRRSLDNPLPSPKPIFPALAHTSTWRAFPPVRMPLPGQAGFVVRPIGLPSDYPLVLIAHDAVLAWSVMISHNLRNEAKVPESEGIGDWVVNKYRLAWGRAVVFTHSIARLYPADRPLNTISGIYILGQSIYVDDIISYRQRPIEGEGTVRTSTSASKPTRPGNRLAFLLVKSLHLASELLISGPSGIILEVDARYLTACTLTGVVCDRQGRTSDPCHEITIPMIDIYARILGDSPTSLTPTMASDSRPSEHDAIRIALAMSSGNQLEVRDHPRLKRLRVFAIGPAHSGWRSVLAMANTIGSDDYGVESDPYWS